ALVSAALASFGSAENTPANDKKTLGRHSVSIALEADTTYWWRVTDVDRNGGSTMSEMASFRTGK
ncbi:MAG TPA: hypothetical protein PK036_00775, partial [Geobacteraceae bacterium]|nr:hypothetical protein [Geobacteraceae bacterium]